MDELVAEVASLERRLNFVKEQNAVRAERDQSHITKLEQRCSEARKTNETLKSQNNDQSRALLETHRDLQYAVVQLGSSKDRIMRLESEKRELLRNNGQKTEEISTYFQEHSKYNSESFVKLSNNANALKFELRREKDER